MLDILRKLAYGVKSALENSDKGMWASDEGMGADGTPSSGIDIIAESTVMNMLDSMGNPFNILSEEKGFVDFGKEYTLVMDPLDGTYNAIRGLPFYSISLAVGKSSISDISHAFVLNLYTGDEFQAEKGKGAYMNGERIRTRRFSMEDSFFSVMLGRRAHEDSYRIAGIPKRVRSLGSAAMEICYVASGSLDMYYYRSPTGGLRVVDIAAASLILRESGGEIYNEKLLPLDMDFDVRKRNSVIAVGDERILEVIG